MSIQMALFSGGNSSRITAIPVDVSAFGIGSVTGAISFNSNGQQTNIVTGKQIGRAHV